MSTASAVILAGGKSRRMHRNKAELLLDGRTFVRILTDKLYALGIRDILISGYAQPVRDAVYVPDSYPGHGPLSGIHAGLSAAASPRVLVVAVDTPLVPVSCLSELLERHERGVTAACCAGHIQPLTAVYDKQLSGDCEALLKSGERHVMALLELAGFCTVPFEDEEILIRGCNTPEEYQTLSEKWASRSQAEPPHKQHPVI